MCQVEASCLKGTLFKKIIQASLCALSISYGIKCGCKGVLFSKRGL